MQLKYERPKNKIEIASSDISAVLDFRYKATISVTDKRTNHFWSPGVSLFLLEFYDLWNERPQKVSLNQNNFKIENYSSNELFLRITHSETGISFLVQFKLDKDSLILRIPIESIVEAKKSQFLLKAIEFNPQGFSAKTGEKGYLLLPNYSGIICRFTRSEPKQYRSLIYLQQSQWEDATVLPILGMVYKNSAFLAIAQSGEFDTEVVISVHWGKEHLNSIHPCFCYRHHRSDQIDQVDRIIKYYFLVGKDANYVGMAKRYRQYLIQTKGILPLREKVSISPEAAYVYNAYSFIKIFCAMKQKQPDSSVQYRIYTTFNEAIQIMERFKKEGIEKGRFILVGWNWDGHDGRYPSRFPIEQRIGGEDGLCKLVDVAHRLNYQITFHDNYSDAYRSSPDWDERIMIKDRDGRLSTGGVWAGGQSYFLCPYKATKLFLHRDLSQIKKLGLNGWYYLDATPRTLRGCYDASHGHPLTRRAEAEGILDQIRIVKDYFGGCSVEMPTAFILSEADEVSHIPCLGIWPLNSRLNYFIDEAVPFFHIAIHGLVQYHLTPWQKFPKLFGSIINGILKEVEWGAMPRTEVTFRPSKFQEYHKHLPWIKKEYELICRKLGYLQLEYIEDYQKKAPDVFETTYSDGSRVIVNYSKKPYLEKKIKVKPLACELIRD